jgi:hypothetical protein
VGVKQGLAIVWMAAITACGNVSGQASIDAAGTDGAPQDAAPAPHKRVFVTSQVYTGNLGGLVGADAKCQVLAGAGGLTGTYKAWLGNATVAAASRLTHATIPYQLVDGTPVAADWAALTSGRLLHAIDRTELGTTPLGGTNTECFYTGDGTAKMVWTNASADGSITNRNQTNSCGNDWNTAGPSTDGGPFGDVGAIGAVDVKWTVLCQSARCENTAPLYCLEQ